MVDVLSGCYLMTFKDAIGGKVFEHCMDKSYFCTFIAHKAYLCIFAKIEPPLNIISLSNSGPHWSILSI